MDRGGQCLAAGGRCLVPAITPAVAAGRVAGRPPLLCLARHRVRRARFSPAREVISHIFCRTIRWRAVVAVDDPHFVGDDCFECRCARPGSVPPRHPLPLLDDRMQARHNFRSVDMWGLTPATCHGQCGGDPPFRPDSVARDHFRFILQAVVGVARLCPVPAVAGKSAAGRYATAHRS